RRGAAALAEDAALAAEADDVPHDQEVAGELEPCDEPELVLELAADGRRHGPVALARARVGERAQVTVRRLAVRQRQLGNAVAQGGERELAGLGDAPAGAQRGGPVAEERGHLGWRTQVPLGVGEEPAPGPIERRAEPDAGEDVQERAAGGR